MGDTSILTAKFLRYLAKKSWALGGEYYQCRDIATGDPVVRLRMADVDDALLAVDEARLAQISWWKSGVKGRQKVFRDLGRLLLQHEDTLVDLTCLLTGKTREDARIEYSQGVNAESYYVRLSSRAFQERYFEGVFPGLSRPRVEYNALGVVGVFSAPEMPLYSSLIDALQPLVAGNAVLHFVDAQTAPVMYALRDLAWAAGMPVGLLHIIPSDSTDLGENVIQLLDHVTFSGSTEIGYEVAPIAHEAFVTTSLFLSTINTAIIMDDAQVDYEEMLQTLLFNTGQSTQCIQRIYVQPGLYPQVLAHLTERFQDKTPSATGEESPEQIGSLFSENKLESCMRLVDDAVDAGATLVTGGRPRPDIAPFFYEPTILTSVPEGAQINREQIQGPVVVIEEMRDVHEVIATVADSPYRFLTAILTRNVAWARSIRSSLEHGVVLINETNCMQWPVWMTPVARNREAGAGVRFGLEGIRQYTRLCSSDERSISLSEIAKKICSDQLCRQLHLNFYAAMNGIYKPKNYSWHRPR
ncbi:MAG: aldehyde dehydrogenase family protein [Actinomycetaceae bacterium]|nr:aldehyde dehydrogenase family protein [Actinomycetaceae bacterium]